MAARVKLLMNPKKNPLKLDGYYTQNERKSYSRITVKKIK